MKQYLIFDGSFVYRPISVITLLDAVRGKVISGRYGIRESSEKDLLAFFQPLAKQGLSPLSCTLDGSTAAIKVVSSLWPGIIIQRCIVHVQRQGLSWCRRNPRQPSAQRLRELFLQVTNIDSKEKRDSFITSLAAWEAKYGRDIACRRERGRVFSDIKRARSMLLRALPDMFHYLDNPAISRSTNGLENYFSRLKSHYRQHRGLPKNKLNNYFKWYLFYQPK